VFGVASREVTAQHCLHGLVDHRGLVQRQQHEQQTQGQPVPPVAIPLHERDPGHDSEQCGADQQQDGRPPARHIGFRDDIEHAYQTEHVLAAQHETGVGHRQVHRDQDSHDSRQRNGNLPRPEQQFGALERA
jgi:hypothetical protein